MAVRKKAATGMAKACGTGMTRENAEEQLAQSPGFPPELVGQTPEELVHELQVHQIELEMQAEELRRAHLELVESRDQYLDLYEFAPVGYLTLDNQALITRANLSAALLLGLDRSNLINARFRSWIVPEDLEIWDRYFRTLLKSEKKHAVSLMLKRGEKTVFSARLESIRLLDSGGVPLIRVGISDISDIRQAERARRDSEHLLKTVIELLPVGVIILDENGKTVAINPEAEQIWGRSPGAGPFPAYRCWRLEDGARIETHDWAGARATDKGETTLEEQIEIESSGGTHKVVLNSALPIRRSDGMYNGAVVVTQDITEGKVAEERIQWLASFAEMNPDPIIELDIQGTLTYANPATRTILADLNLPDDPALFIPWDRAGIIRMLKKSISPRIYREISLGNEIFSEDITLDTGLQVVRIYVHTITGRRKSEDALKESEEFNRSLVENLPDYIVVCGPDLKILYVNPAVEQALGRAAHRMTGSSVLRYIPEKDHDRVARKIADLYSGAGMRLKRLQKTAPVSR
jgi:PAS domain S-box-containing protein